jgi:NAD(P)-dependent dehydrogenase (short-subunit alcohol dehydrogenase family)
VAARIERTIHQEKQSMAQPKIWFVTGASRGFGRIWTEAALERGDKVAATARDLKALDNLVGAHGDSILALPLDVTDRDAVFEAVRQAHRHFGHLDVILCNAGYGYMGAIEEVATAEAQANFDTNLFGTLAVIQAALPLLRAQRSGHILTVSSIGGVIGFPTGGIYVATIRGGGNERGPRGRSRQLRHQGQYHRTGQLRHRVQVFDEGRAGYGRVRGCPASGLQRVQARNVR